MFWHWHKRPYRFANDNHGHYEAAVKNLYHKINSDYNPQIIPAGVNGSVLLVRVNMFIRKIDRIDDNNMVS